MSDDGGDACCHGWRGEPCEDCADGRCACQNAGDFVVVEKGAAGMEAAAQKIATMLDAPASGRSEREPRRYSDHLPGCTIRRTGEFVCSCGVGLYNPAPAQKDAERRYSADAPPPLKRWTLHHGPSGLVHEGPCDRVADGGICLPGAEREVLVPLAALEAERQKREDLDRKAFGLVGELERTKDKLAAAEERERETNADFIQLTSIAGKLEVERDEARATVENAHSMHCVGSGRWAPCYIPFENRAACSFRPHGKMVLEAALAPVEAKPKGGGHDQAD